MSKKIGDLFEQQAISFLKDKNYSIIKTNYFFRNLEIDIIALSPQNILTFTEVKYRKSFNKNNFSIHLSITQKKQKNIIQCADYFLNYFSQYQQYFCRFDVIFFYHIENLLKIEHIENAFTI